MRQRHSSLDDVDMTAPSIAFTTAPDAYDGFGTQSVCTVGHLDGKPLRQVEIQAVHYTWQTARYASGMYPAFTPEQYADLCTRPWYQAQQPSVAP